MTTTQNMRLQLLIEAAENAVDNFAMPKGTNYYWDELRASILLAKRDCIDNQDTCADCGVGAGEHADDCPRLEPLTAADVHKKYPFKNHIKPAR